jgi:hypothetical protein
VKRILLAMCVVSCGASPSPVVVIPSPVADTSASANTTTSASSAPRPKPPNLESGAGETTEITFQRALRLLEAGRYEELILTLVDPADLVKVRQEKSIEQIVQDFVDEHKDKELTELLQRAQTQTPRTDPQTHVLTYVVPTGVLRMREVDGRWYIKN